MRRLASLGAHAAGAGPPGAADSVAIRQAVLQAGQEDRNDAEAIGEAAAWPGVRHVPVKTAGQQADAMLLSVRELLVGQRTQLANALRGHAAEFGLVAATGNKGVAQLRADVA